MKLKVLEVPFWAKSSVRKNINPMSDALTRMKKIDPILNREGFYYDRISKKCWVECDSGCYELDNNDSFISDLDELNHVFLTLIEEEALRKLILTGKSIYKKFKPLIKRNEYYKYLKQIGKNAQKVKLRIIKRRRNIHANNGV